MLVPVDLDELYIFLHTATIFLSRFRLCLTIYQRVRRNRIYTYMYIHGEIPRRVDVTRGSFRRTKLADLCFLYGSYIPLSAARAATGSCNLLRNVDEKIPYTECMLHLCVVSIFWLPDIILVIYIRYPEMKFVQFPISRI